MANPNDSFINGLIISVDATGLIITVGNGKCYLPGTGRASTSTPINLTVSGLTSNSWLHVYAYASGSNMAIEASATAPDVPYQGNARTKTGDATRRYLASLRVGAASTLMQILHIGGGPDNNRIYFYAPTGLPSAGATLLTGILTQTATVASASAALPVTARLMLTEIANSAGLPFYLSNPDIGTVSATSYLRSVAANTTVGVELLVNSTQQFSYVYGAGITLGGSATIRTTGYIYGR